MQIAAIKRVTEVSEGNITALETVFLVQTGETVESLLRRVNLCGTAKWHYDYAEVRLKLVKPPEA
jgi:coproporphyrinogen III oxidase